MDEKARSTHVYHYTTSDGLMGIVEKQAIWATDIFYLNDRMEFHHGKDLFKRSLESLPDDGETGAAQRFLRALSGLDLDMPKHIFVCSFSQARKGDDLSQWRAYCPNGGYAIGFPIDRLEACAKRSCFVLKVCQYVGNEGSADDIVLNEAKKVLAEMKEKIEPLGDQVEDNDCYRKCLIPGIAMCKNKGFEAEVEWRLISSFDLNASPEFRSAGASLVPYIPVSLDDKDLWENARIVLSPCSEETSKLRLESVKAFLRSKLTDCGLPTVQPSQIPYRIAPTG